ncbi:type 1 glutamine amidotransferase [Pelotomaculum propionicicum]|uniref:GMP synthase (Glutamine-hydrolyzing) n=1 Tax=Pelotomaculum propionicicum TaxID=258475 RepID=A0A4Y7RWC2_9FIRM|nr:type 1 glutamine amidotransferase [Pelotomaculum propionicicum]TEB13019.1 GMP synthase (glutamine-hydrolyzing) [Pelotomaculum propionicicum]
MKALVVQTVDIVRPGLIKDVLEEAGWLLDIRLMERPGSFLPDDLTGFGALIVLGGPMNVYEEDAYPYLRQVDLLIKQAVKQGMPVLGTCLGGQLIAKALGAPVTLNPVQEIGWYLMRLTAEGSKSPFFKDLPGEFPVFHWHSDTFALPGGASHLAETGACANQAFSYGPNVLAVQFHLEITPSIIYDWNREWAGDIEEFHGPGSVAKLEAETALIWPGCRQAAVQIIKNWAVQALAR